jgi:hypothetical protein
MLPLYARLSLLLALGAFAAPVTANQPAGHKTIEYRYFEGIGKMTLVFPESTPEKPMPAMIGLWSAMNGGNCEFRAVEDISMRRSEGSVLVLTFYTLRQDGELGPDIIEARFVNERNVYFDDPPRAYLCTRQATFAGRWVQVKK